ncbi:nose resistant to fluoxetine protein 6-like [Ischnura elegans]|uniref:nose resistant to fluoxetine protein 6-like n=1 Tax=Ischnura elegans TaxID=197161 RepID=UPI001ED88712|nr:nose resistant to fluoxetine protein 6-like [Ischnura elegans]
MSPCFFPLLLLLCAPLGGGGADEGPRRGPISVPHPPIADILDVYDPYRLQDSAERLTVHGVNENCARDMDEFVAALQAGAPWAFKMLDSTGRYSQGLFWGNGYWLGSNSLCNEIDTNATMEGAARNEVDYDAGSDFSDNSPMRVAFHILKFKIQLTDRSFYVQTPGLIFLGMCLPRSCGHGDAIKITSTTIEIQDEMWAQNPLPRKILLLDDKYLSGEYSYWKDPRVYIMIAAVGSVALMTIVGTIYELWLISASRSKDNSSCKDSNSDHEMSSIHTEEMEPSKISECNGNHIAYAQGPLCVSDHMLSSRMERNITMASEALSLSGKGAHEGIERLSLPRTTDDDMVLKPQQKTVMTRLLLCFSAVSNAKSICSLSVGDDTIAPIHGLRFFSLLWVILAHTCLVAFQFSDNKTFRARAEQDLLYQTLSSGTYSVDTFFFISGLLVSFLYFRTVSKYDVHQLTYTSGGFKAKGIQFIGMVIYRFLRLTPPYMFVLGLVEVTMKYCHDHGSLEPVATDYINCPKYWWRNVLYINTMFPLEQRCMSWSWYLANDTQFYIVGTIILIIAVNYFWLATGMVVVFMLSAWSTTAVITIYTEHTPTTQDPFAHYDELYDKPWTRIGPYLIGMCLGWVLFKTKCKINFKKWVLTVGWVVSMTILFLVIYSLYFFEFGPAASAVYVSLSHSAWALALAWIVLVCASGNGGYVNEILSWKYIYPVSRITYCSYLLHPVLMRSIACNSDSPSHVGKDLITIAFLGYVLASYGFSFLISLAFEAPVVALLRLAHPMKRTKATT